MTANPHADTLMELRAVLESLTVSTDGPESGPWEPRGQLVRRGGDCSWWLDNPRQTSSFPDGDDVAVLLNGVIALLDRLEAAEKALRRVVAANDRYTVRPPGTTEWLLAAKEIDDAQAVARALLGEAGQE